MTSSDFGLEQHSEQRTSYEILIALSDLLWIYNRAGRYTKISEILELMTLTDLILPEINDNTINKS